MTESLNSTPAGWYVDPMTHQHLRWWNGQAWTESVAPLPGAPAAQVVAPAPRVQQRFAIGAGGDDSSQPAAGAAAGQAPATAYSENDGFVTQVPAYAARVEQQRAEPQVSAQPAIPWPAMGGGSTSTEAGHYKAQYGDALELLKGTSLVSGSGGADAAPAYRRAATNPIATQSHEADAALPQTGLSQRETPPVGDVRPDLAFASPQEQEAAARLADEAHRAELARQEQARLEWDRQFQAQQAIAEEQRLAQLADVQQQLDARAQAAEAAQAQTSAPQHPVADAEGELESTLMSRRQRREQPTHGVTPAPSAAPVPDSGSTEDVWAGPEDRRADVKPQWSTVGKSRAAEREPLAPIHWGTVSVWLLTITPWLGALAVFVALALFEPWSLPALGVLALPWLIGVLWAQQDATRLAELGHERRVRPAWAALTVPVYLALRTLRVRKETGAGWAPLIIWALNAAAVIAIVVALGAAPTALPAYLVTALTPLRESAGGWLGR